MSCIYSLAVFQKVLAATWLSRHVASARSPITGHRTSAAKPCSHPCCFEAPPNSPGFDLLGQGHSDSNVGLTIQRRIPVHMRKRTDGEHGPPLRGVEGRESARVTTIVNRARETGKGLALPGIMTKLTAVARESVLFIGTQ
jgi:hypothetical protein